MHFNNYYASVTGAQRLSDYWLLYTSHSKAVLVFRYNACSRNVGKNYCNISGKWAIDSPTRYMLYVYYNKHHIQNTT